MDENILGKNIKYLRTMNGETLEELGNVIRASKKTIQGYESGRRMPDIATIEKIAHYYGKMVDELVHNKLYELEKISSDKIIKMDEIMDTLLHILPVIETDEACRNKSFLKGVTEIRNMISSFRNGIEVQGVIISEIIDCFIIAIGDDIIEAVGNMIWCIFFLWTQQYTDLDKIKKLQVRINKGESDWKEFKYEYQKDVKKSSSKKKAFVYDYDELLFELIGELKATKKWSQLGDYYLALRYVVGLIDTGYSDEMNQAVGIQMLIAFAQVGNKYYLDFLETSNNI